MFNAVREVPNKRKIFPRLGEEGKLKFKPVDAKCKVNCLFILIINFMGSGENLSFVLIGAIIYIFLMMGDILFLFYVSPRGFVLCLASPDNTQPLDRAEFKKCLPCRGLYSPSETFWHKVVKGGKGSRSPLPILEPISSGPPP